jgi:hypothetical protein
MDFIFSVVIVTVGVAAFIGGIVVIGFMRVNFARNGNSCWKALRYS